MWGIWKLLSQLFYKSKIILKSIECDALCYMVLHAVKCNKNMLSVCIYVQVDNRGCFLIEKTYSIAKLFRKLF